MNDSTLLHYAERELKYQARKQISKKIRDNCPEESSPMATGIIVMLGTIMAMAVFNDIIGSGGRGRWR